ncbi:MAG: DedA family protein [Rhodobacterales bacterium]|nr:DedA family protein [Rhodobacterales bacterium]
MFDMITGWIAAGGLWAVGGLMLLENVFPPIPSELVMPLAGFLAASGEMTFLGVIAMGTLGSVLGALLWYFVGRAFGRERVFRLIDSYGVWLALSCEETERAFAWFGHWGYWAVFFGRLVPGVRTLISVPAGLVRMPFLPFLLTTALGSLIWVTALTLAGYVLQANYHQVEGWVSPVTTWIVISVVALYVYRVVRQLLAR